MPKAPTFTELKDFTLKSYMRLLVYLNDVYNIVPFCEIPKEDEPYLILRHDIDFSLSAALRIARIEKDLGVKSTYFFLFSVPFYNLLEGNKLSVLNQILELGHEIGLHYSPHQYRLYGQNPKKTLKIEIRLLERLINRKVYSIARHGPWDIDPLATTKEYISANHPRLKRDMYIHDSCRAWNPPQALLKLLNDPPMRVQLLIHPFCWQEDKISRDELIERLFQNHKNDVTKIKKRLKKVWKTCASDYDSFIKNGEFTWFHDEKDGLNKIGMHHSLKYYSELFRWYIINMIPFGWNIHKLKKKIQRARWIMHAKEYMEEDGAEKISNRKESK